MRRSITTRGALLAIVAIAAFFLIGFSEALVEFPSPDVWRSGRTGLGYSPARITYDYDEDKVFVTDPEGKYVWRYNAADFGPGNGSFPEMVFGKPLSRGFEFPAVLGTCLDDLGTLWVASNATILGFSNASGVTLGAEGSLRPNYVIREFDYKDQQVEFPYFADWGGVMDLECGNGDDNLWILLPDSALILMVKNFVQNYPEDGSIVVDGLLGAPGGLGNACLEISAGCSSSFDGLAFDKVEGDLWVVDSATPRVLRYRNAVPLSMGDDESVKLADLVIGQPDFSTSSPNTTTPSINNFDTPLDVLFLDDTLIVADWGHHRLMGFYPPFYNGMPATWQLGQESFDVAVETSMDPACVAYDSYGDRLAVCSYQAMSVNLPVIGEAPSASPSESQSPSPSESESPSASPSQSPSESQTPSPSESQAPSSSESPSPSESTSPSRSPSSSRTSTPSRTPSRSPSESPSTSPSPSITPSPSPSRSISASRSSSPTPRYPSPSRSPVSPSFRPSPSIRPSTPPPTITLHPQPPHASPSPSEKVHCTTASQNNNVLLFRRKARALSRGK